MQLGREAGVGVPRCDNRDTLILSHPWGHSLLSSFPVLSYSLKFQYSLLHFSAVTVWPKNSALWTVPTSRTVGPICSAVMSLSAALCRSSVRCFIFQRWSPAEENHFLVCFKMNVADLQVLPTTVLDSDITNLINIHCLPSKLTQFHDHGTITLL